MEPWQRIVIISYSVFSLFGAVLGYYQCKFKKNSLGGNFIFNLIGAFVWADNVVFGTFWFLGSLVILYFNNWNLFLFAQSLFWLVRSVGETIYWFNQQFSTINRNPAKNYWITKIFHDEYTVWFVHQIMWQCLTVVFIILSLYFGRLFFGGVK